ncbi:RNA polymerase sigma factor [Catellatospora sp. TT07R-123]|uniref:SigB/SigF/SigG family RNA polymerase sigma factor n=1 Tax=Catellatospora sp. TT07R-123 TaxID=2733863 RepID=UPI001B0F9A14|nr:SigB/SigF/SigG family RNA polymerase sigma factor [Catellatospora sp. TT07R-123]GHJ45356.1 RNA polymerase sigma factor [Catellatospora sp. TT07R-123]
MTISIISTVDRKVAVESPVSASVSSDDLDGPMAEAVLVRLAEAGPDDPAREDLRQQAICAWLPLAERLARRFRHRGVDTEDLVQVATVGLIQAIDRFDPSRGSAFVHFAVPTVVGELKRHFRDRGWSMRVSRRMQELYLDVNRVSPQLSQELGRWPTSADLAEHLGTTVEEVRSAVHCAQAYRTGSLNVAVSGEDGDLEIGELIGEADQDIEAVADLHALRQYLKELPTRERRILSLRFGCGYNQAQIAEQIGVSQMHVSRLLTRCIGTLRQQMLADA